VKNITLKRYEVLYPIMVQKQSQKDRETNVEDIAEGLSNKIKNEKSSRNGTLSKLYSSVAQEGSTEKGAVSGLLTSFIGLVVAGVLPFTIIPMLLGFSLGGAVLGKLMPNSTHSVLGGVAVSSFLTFFLFVNIPILGLGLISTLIFTVVATGASVAAYEYSSN
jgi:hypothetical protein